MCWPRWSRRCSPSAALMRPSRDLVRGGCGGQRGGRRVLVGRGGAAHGVGADGRYRDRAPALAIVVGYRARRSPRSRQQLVFGDIGVRFAASGRRRRHDHRGAVRHDRRRSTLRAQLAPAPRPRGGRQPSWPCPRRSRFRVRTRRRLRVWWRATDTEQSELAKWVPLDAADQTVLTGQLSEALQAAERYPTVASAKAAGMILAGGMAPGVGRALPADQRRTSSRASTRTAR